MQGSGWLIGCRGIPVNFAHREHDCVQDREQHDGLCSAPAQYAIQRSSAGVPFMTVRTSEALSAPNTAASVELRVVARMYGSAA